jgi:hypothetical protein
VAVPLGIFSLSAPSPYSFLLSFPLPAGVAFAFEKLVVYQKSIDFADAVCQQTEQFAATASSSTSSTEPLSQSPQISRRATAVPPQTACRLQPPLNPRKYRGGQRPVREARLPQVSSASRGSVQECVLLLELAARRTLPAIGC